MPAAHGRVQPLHCQPHVCAPAPQVTRAAAGPRKRVAPAPSAGLGCSVSPLPRPGRAAAPPSWSGARLRPARRAPARRACDRAKADKARGRREEHAPRPAAVGAQLAQERRRERRRRVYVRRRHLPACAEARRRVHGGLGQTHHPWPKTCSGSRFEEQGRAGSRRRAAQQGARAIRQSVSASPA